MTPYLPSRREVLKGTIPAGISAAIGCKDNTPTAVLTFDDAVKSHRHFVAPLLHDLGFRATFFVTHRWMDDTENFMNWDEIAEIGEMGFEIGNHSWSHPNFSIPKNAARLEGELALVENQLARVGISKPVSFAWCGNHFGPEALAKLDKVGYTFARRGLSPEIDSHSPEPGPAFDPSEHHRLLIPTTGNAVPDWSLERFRRVLDRSDEGIVVLQFHGVPDSAHPWVHTPPDLFQQYMAELRTRGFRVLAMSDLERVLPSQEPGDPNLGRRNPPAAQEELEQPVERLQTRKDLVRWTDVMLRHDYTASEAASVAGFSDEELIEYDRRLDLSSQPDQGRVEVHAYPGGRHPRIGFLEGAIGPLRGTKASVFLPWEPDSYIVLDLPELITSDFGHLFLAHTHVPTIWTDRNVWLDNVDMRPMDDGGLELEWALPNGVEFGSTVSPNGRSVELELWLRNGLDQPLSGLRTQLCVMLKGAPEFNAQTRENKVFDSPVAAVHSAAGNRWILTAWERAGRCWGNDRCPCLHSDPVFPDCAPGETVTLKGRLWFEEGASIEESLEAAKREFPALRSS